ncbi:MAG: ATP-binding protein [Ktedonobacteraceae bacterium]
MIAQRTYTLLRQLHHYFPLGIRLQLALWYTCAFAALLLLTGAVFYKYLENSLEGSVDSALQVLAQQEAGGIEIKNGALITSAIAEHPANGGTGSADAIAQPADVNYGLLIRVLDTRGRVVSETPAFQTLYVPQDSVTQPLAGEPWQGTVHSGKDQEVRLYSRMLTQQGQKIAVIQVGQSLAQLHTLLHRLVAALLIAGFLVLLLCAGVSYWLAARAFAPIQRLAETARRIKVGDLHQRVPVPPARDEIQYLALTLNEMIGSLDQAFTRQRRFVADASHELRTPVAVIRNKTGITLLGTPSLPETITVLQDIRIETERLSHLISDLLALARGDEGQARFEYEPMRLDLLVEAVAANAEVLASERDIVLSVEIDGEVPLQADEARLIQVVMNLLDNALRYTDSGGRVVVSVGTRHGDAYLSVRDTGIGIAPEHLPHIFERFYRADAARRQTSGSSSGLGLSIVEWIVRMHGGSIAVESQPGQGSIFTVTLPGTLTKKRQELGERAG